VTLLFIFLILLAVLGLCGCTGFSLVVADGTSSLVEVRGLLIAVASLVAEHRLQGERASVVAAPGLQRDPSAVYVQRTAVYESGGQPTNKDNFCNSKHGIKFHHICKICVVYFFVIIYMFPSFIF